MADPSPLKKQKVSDKDVESSENKEATSKAMTIVIGTRRSQLAMWQANHVAEVFRKAHPNSTFDVRGLQTTGDKDQNTSLSLFSNKGIFTKELDIALLNNSIDVAVHCIKDLPTILPAGLTLAAILKRGPVGDAVVLHAKHKGKKLSELGPGTIIGTGALRRRAILAKYFPHLVFKDIRGNLNTRLRKLDQGDYDGIILARIGLERLGMENRISQDLDISKYGYAVGQGALGIVTRENDEPTKKVAIILEDTLTRWECSCERGMLFTLEGGCKLPVVVRTKFDKIGNDEDKNKMMMSMWGGVLTLDGRRLVETTVQKDFDLLGEDQQSRAYQLGCELANILKKNGASEILKVITTKLEAERKTSTKVDIWTQKDTGGSL